MAYYVEPMSTDTTILEGFHAHVYYDADSKAEAEALAARQQLDQTLVLIPQQKLRLDLSWRGAVS